MTQKPARVVVFAKAPVAGAVKTRLIPALGPDGAAALAARMLERTIAQVTSAGLDLELCVAPDLDALEWRGFLPEGLRVTDQGTGDLGERLARAAERVIGGGQAAMLIGTDCPALDADRLRDAAARLGTHDAALIPALDGGYVLLGLTRFHPSLFDRIEWSTAAVAATTMERVAALGWSLFVGEGLRDIDEPADLVHLG